MADSLRPGGIYILGFHLLPPDAAPECIERWTARHGRTRLTVTLRVLATDRRRRLEKLRISLLVPQGASRCGCATSFRCGCTRPPSSAACWPPCRLELCDVYDFWYEIDRPLRLSDELSDTVFVLRRKAEGGRGKGKEPRA